MLYTVELTRPAARQFQDLPADTQARIALRIDVLADDPRPHGCEKIAGSQNIYRIRAGDYR